MHFDSVEFHQPAINASKKIKDANFYISAQILVDITILASISLLYIMSKKLLTCVCLEVSFPFLIQTNSRRLFQKRG